MGACDLATIHAGGHWKSPRSTRSGPRIAVERDAEWSRIHAPRLRDPPTCRSGVRAVLAAATLKTLGYADVVNLGGGIAAWKEAGLPIAEHHEGM